MSEEEHNRSRDSSLLSLPSLKHTPHPVQRSKSLLRSLSPSRSRLDIINPLHFSQGHHFGSSSSSKRKSGELLTNGSPSKSNFKIEDADSNDCGKAYKSKNIVTMLTAASMYAGMEADVQAGEDGEEEGIDVDDDDEEGSVSTATSDATDISAPTSTDPQSTSKSKTLTKEDLQEAVAGLEQDREPTAAAADDDELQEPEFPDHAAATGDDDDNGPIEIDSSKIALSKVTPPSVPLLRRRSTALELSLIQKFSSSASHDQSTNTQRALALSEKLKTTFAIDDDEEFLTDYSCWLLRDVLLQGHLYLTKSHILFFAFLPRKQGKVSMSGSIGLRSYPSRRVIKRWAVLRDCTLSFYSSSTDLYFPTLTINLQTALRAEVVNHHVRSIPGKHTLFGSKALSPEPKWIKLLTETQTYILQADSANAANEWVASLKKHIFAARNKGNHVAIKVPLPNVLDLELTPVFENTQTLRLKVIESSETYAIDDYYLMFFNRADEAVDSIKNAVKVVNPDFDVSESHLDLAQVMERSSGQADKDASQSDIATTTDEDSVVTSPTLKPNTSASFIKSPRFRSSSLHKLGRTLSPKFSGRHGRDQADAANSDMSSNSVVEKVVRYDDDDDVPEIVLNDQGNVKQLNNDSSPSSESSDFFPIDRSPVTNEFSLETNVNDLDEVYQNQQSRWTPKALVKGVYNSTASGITHVSNLSTMWSSNPHHYDEVNSLERGAEDPYLIKDAKERLEATQRFQKQFSLPMETKLISSYYAHLIKNVPMYGKIYLGDDRICYRSLIPGTNTLMILPFEDIENVYKEKGFRFGYSGLVIVIHGHEELFFEFGSSEARDDCETLLLKQIDNELAKKMENASIKNNNVDSVKLADSVTKLADARVRYVENKLNYMYGMNVPIILENSPYSRTDFKPNASYRFTLLTIGSRGDVQPYIALGKGLMKEGHRVKIVTHSEFQPWIEKHGMSFKPIAGDPAELMNLMVTHGTLSVAFLRDASSKFRGWITELLSSSWDACQDTDILIESPSAMAGVHIAEALNIPYFRAFTMPWTKTRAYPHAFIVPDQKRGGSYNYLTHVMFENVFWKGISGQVNKWRVETLKLPRTNLEHLQQSKIPFLYNISPTVFPPSVDFASWVKVTGYWFLDEGNTYDPPKELVAFMKKARDDGKKLVYIGFGSIVVSDPKELTEAVVSAVQDADVRCILNKGWSERLGAADAKQVEVPLPSCIYNSGSIPHDWLFGQIDAAVHHGGSGTTGATLRAGLPTIIKPFFGDQFFYANRIVDIGAGIALRKLNSKSLSKAMKEATSNQRIIQKAKDIGQKIREENGVNLAIATIYSELEYAKQLIISKREKYGPALDKQTEELEDGDKSNDDSWLIV